MTTWQKADNLVRQAREFLDGGGSSSYHHDDGDANAVAAHANKVMSHLLRNFIAVTTSLQEHISLAAQTERGAVGPQPQQRRRRPGEVTTGWFQRLRSQISGGGVGVGVGGGGTKRGLSLIHI